MDRLNKIKHLIHKGYTYDEKTGNITSHRGNIIKSTCAFGYSIIYFKINNKKFILKSHQFAWYITNNEIVDEIDHINGIRNDNRIVNLRKVNSQQNKFNNTKAKGFYFHKGRNKFRSRIKVDGVDIHLGYFNTENEARKSYLDAKKIYHKIN